jgi:hypothetical protein
MGTGRTQPILVECERSDGSICEVVAKLSHGECQVSGLIREAFSAMLAADLGLPVPEPLWVQFPVAFIETLRPDHNGIANRIEESVAPTFGSTFVRSVNTLLPRLPLPHKLFDTAAEIATFDAICRNPDRNAMKPNCLTDNETVLVMIDHELAMAGSETLGTFIDPYPWQVGGMTHLLGGPNEHILLKAVKGKGATIDRLEAAWAGIQPQRIAEYAAAIPSTWGTEAVADDIRDNLMLVLANLAGAFAEARRMML